MPPPPPMAPPPKKSGAGTVAAVMYILGAIFLLITLGLGIMAAAAGTIAAGNLKSDDVNKVVGYIWGVCVILPLIGMIFGFLGAVFIFQRKKFTIAMVGGILGLLAGILSGLIFIAGLVIPNYLGLLAFIFFLIGLIMLMMVKKDFS